ncbi:MAG: glycosyltransferase family 2 protein [Pseudobdellovibrionaceae bacterium]
MKIGRNKVPQLALVIPCYNEELALPHCASKVLEVFSDLQKDGIISDTSYCLFVDDGSHDATWKQIEKTHHEGSKKFKGLKLSRNFGHQKALLAGLEAVEGTCDCSISMDADLQHDVNILKEMLNKYQQGYEVVLAIKNDRGDSPFKKITALSFYRLARFLGTKIVKNHADFRLLSRPALKALHQFQEYNMFIRGLVPELGFKQAVVYFDVQERIAGKSKYSIYKMLSLALNGVTSFSMAPLRLVTVVGLLVLLGSLGISAFIVFQYFNGHTIPGWTSTVLPIYFLGAIQMLSIGILGEYLGKTFLEVKRRPRYLVEEELM